MRAENRQALERLSTICDICGLFSVLIGFIVIVLDLFDNNYQHLQVGIYVFVVGYGSVKTSHQIAQVLVSERYDEEALEREKEREKKQGACQAVRP